MNKNVKFNSKYYQEKVLHPMYAEEIPFLYPNGFHRIKLHQEKATNHTSKTPLHSLTKTKTKKKKMNISASIEYIPISHTPVNSSDASSMASRALSLQKRAIEG